MIYTFWLRCNYSANEPKFPGHRISTIIRPVTLHGITDLRTDSPACRSRNTGRRAHRARRNARHFQPAPPNGVGCAHKGQSAMAPPWGLSPTCRSGLSPGMLVAACRRFSLVPLAGPVACHRVDDRCAVQAGSTALHLSALPPNSAGPGARDRAAGRIL